MTNAVYSINVEDEWRDAKSWFTMWIYSQTKSRSLPIHRVEIHYQFENLPSAFCTQCGIWMIRRANETIKYKKRDRSSGVNQIERFHWMRNQFTVALLRSRFVFHELFAVVFVVVAIVVFSVAVYLPKKNRYVCNKQQQWQHQFSCFSLLLPSTKCDW